jgi:hypothetical protein
MCVAGRDARALADHRELAIPAAVLFSGSAA